MMVICIAVLAIIVVAVLFYLDYLRREVEVLGNRINNIKEDMHEVKAKIIAGDQYTVVAGRGFLSFPREFPVRLVVRALIDYLGLDLDIIREPQYDGLTIKKKAE